MKGLRIYIDTSVVGGCLDDEFSRDSRALLDLMRRGKAVLLLSDILAGELNLAPADVQSLLETIPDEGVESIMATPETLRLRDAYIKAGVVGPGHANDAHHVALATVARADMIVSWNFRHIVHFEKMRGFNAVNLREGYTPIEIHTPREVV